MSFHMSVNWAHQDLNLGPADYESDALTTELQARKANDGTRTHNLLITNQQLCQLSYISMCESKKRDSNPQRSAWKADTLPIELFLQIAHPAGFEPATCGLEGRCSSTELWMQSVAITTKAARSTTDIGTRPKADR